MRIYYSKLQKCEVLGLPLLHLPAWRRLGIHGTQENRHSSHKKVDAIQHKPLELRGGYEALCGTESQGHGHGAYVGV